MYALLAGLGLFLLLLFASRSFAYGDATKIARGIRRFGWVALLLLGGLLLLPGLIVIAVPLGVLGYSLLRRGGIRFRTFGGLGGPGAFGGGLGGGIGGMRHGSGRARRPGQKSFIRTAMLEMVLDHDTGRVDGRCVAGRFAGRALSELNMTELRELAAALQQGDPQEAALLHAYLNQRAPGWQDASGARGEGSEGAGAWSNGAGYRGRSRASGGMSVDEAYEVLGLRRSATRDEIRIAHRQLMKKVHPDQGGSTYLAARINEAKEILLNLH